MGVGHAQLCTTQIYLNPVTEDVIAGLLAFHARQRDRDPAAPPAAHHLGCVSIFAARRQANHRREGCMRVSA